MQFTRAIDCRYLGVYDLSAIVDTDVHLISSHDCQSWRDATGTTVTSGTQGRRPIAWVQLVDLSGTVRFSFFKGVEGAEGGPGTDLTGFQGRTTGEFMLRGTKRAGEVSPESYMTLVKDGGASTGYLWIGFD